ncbi:MAG: hypothetical protein Q9227_006492 [Pyrenula ochraceoflavens]
MVRLLTLAGLVAGVIGTSHMSNSEMSGQGMSGDSMSGQGMSGDSMSGQGMSGESSQGMSGQSQGQQSSSQGGSTETITITIVASNAGGGAQTQQMNPPMMAPGMTHQVTVGGNAGLVYTPDSIMAQMGDMVQFNFMSMNHTVTQSSFAEPCVKMANGADSGFMANPNNTMNPPPMMMMQVMTTDPIWMYCRQKGHCGKGMAFSINPKGDKSQAAFKAAAIAQNGTASASASAAAPPPSAASPPPAAAPPAAAPPAAAPPAAASSGSVVSGQGSTQNGQCTCSCLCGSSAFPAGAGMGMMGGMSGAMPAAAAGMMMRRSEMPLIA